MVEIRPFLKGFDPAEIVFCRVLLGRLQTAINEPRKSVMNSVRAERLSCVVHWNFGQCVFQLLRW
jgi:hypothetical protein